VLGRVGVRHRLVPEKAPVRLRDQFAVLGLRSSDAPQHQAVLGSRQGADLPTDVTDPAGRLPKPLGHGSLAGKFDGVVAGEDDLLDGQFQPGHVYISLAGSVRTNLVARSIQSVNCSSPSTPSGSTSTQPFMARPVVSNSRTCGSLRASSPSSGPR